MSTAKRDLDFLNSLTPDQRWELNLEFSRRFSDHEVKNPTNGELCCFNSCFYDGTEDSTWTYSIPATEFAFLIWLTMRREAQEAVAAPQPVEDDARDAAQQREALLEIAMDDREQTIAMIADRIVRTSPGLVRAGVTAAYDAGQAAERERWREKVRELVMRESEASFADAATAQEVLHDLVKFGA